jgi:predicted Zn-ribbon and HTH transcriptional regulator
MSKTIKIAEVIANKNKRTLDMYQWKCSKCSYLICETDIFTPMKIEIRYRCPNCKTLHIGIIEFEV